MKNVSKIEEAAKHYSTIDGNSDDSYREEDAFIVGASSRSAKEYHTIGMYTETEVKLLLEERSCYCIVHAKDDDADYVYTDVWFDRYKKK